jgi:hypothetical protein
VSRINEIRDLVRDKEDENNRFGSAQFRSNVVTCDSALFDHHLCASLV